MEYVQDNYVKEGMCADVCIHNNDPKNPHVHIMTTVRPLNPDGTWQHKTEKEYLCMRNGEERFGCFSTAQNLTGSRLYGCRV